MGNKGITGVLNPTSTQDVATKNYIDLTLGAKLNNIGDTMGGDLDMNINKITNASDPVSSQDVVTKNYLDTTEGVYNNFGYLMESHFQLVLIHY